MYIYHILYITIYKHSGTLSWASCLLVASPTERDQHSDLCVAPGGDSWHIPYFLQSLHGWNITVVNLDGHETLMVTIGVSCSSWCISCFADILCILWCTAWSMCSSLATSTALLLRWSYCFFLGALQWVSHGIVIGHHILAVGLMAPPICCPWHTLQGVSSLPICCTILPFLFMLLLGLGVLGLWWHQEL